MAQRIGIAIRPGAVTGHFEPVMLEECGGSGKAPGERCPDKRRLLVVVSCVEELQPGAGVIPLADPALGLAGQLGPGGGVLGGPVGREDGVAFLRAGGIEDRADRVQLVADKRAGGHIRITVCVGHQACASGNYRGCDEQAPALHICV